MVADVEPGDVLMVTARPGSDFAQLILALDNAPGRFSHCGIAVGDGRIISARLFPEWRFPVDLGGLIVEPFSSFWRKGQLIHRLQVDPAEREAAVARLRPYCAQGGSFSVPKVVAIAAALHALDRDNPLHDTARARIVRRAAAVADAWACDGDFYCAEFVTTVYEWDFTVDDLRPPRSHRRPVVPWIAQHTDQLGSILFTAGIHDLQRRTLHALVTELRSSDPAFLGPDPQDSIERFVRGIATRLGLATPEPEPVDDTPLTREEPIPRALVTPRMVLSKHLADGLPPLVRRRRGSVR